MVHIVIVKFLNQLDKPEECNYSYIHKSGGFSGYLQGDQTAAAKSVEEEE